jgi:16S rRNA (guanine(966)-N(2))-methyltransferase RsmD
VRVIAGRFKGRRLKAPSWDGIRPTSDKLRETLFNVLSPRVDGARVVDGFAGTGAVGIEALSRGAAHVTFIERDRRAAALVAANLQLCGQQRGYTIECGEVAMVLRRQPSDASFDLILLDPPYDIESSAVKTTLEAAARCITPDGLIVMERATRRTPDVPPALSHVRDITSGDSTLTILRRA